MKPRPRVSGVPVPPPVQKGENASPTETAAVVKQNAKALNVVNAGLETMIKRNDIVLFTHNIAAVAKPRKDARTDESNKLKIFMYMQN